MKIAVIVDNYNYARFIGEALLSVKNQVRAADQIIVVDDGSTDNSLEVLNDLKSSLPNLQIVAKPNGGQLSAFNAAVEKVQADVVTFLDSDDWYHPEYLAEVEKQFISGKADVLFCTPYCRA